MAPRTQTRGTFPATMTASTWASVLDAVRKRATDAHGALSIPGALPKLTNAEALQLVRAWTLARSRARFPLWYQFAAVAYGWDPAHDTLDTSSAQGSRPYPSDATSELWAAMVQLAAEADSDNTSPTASLYFDDAWSDPTLAADVRNALRGDGADAAFKIPLPACKDPKTGKPVGKPQRDPKTGKWRCEPVAVDDPITHAGKHVFAIAAVILSLWWLVDDRKPRRRRRT